MIDVTFTTDTLFDGTEVTVAHIKWQEGDVAMCRQLDSGKWAAFFFADDLGIPQWSHGIDLLGVAPQVIADPDIEAQVNAAFDDHNNQLTLEV